MHKLIIYTKNKCHLCDEMKEILKRVHKEIEFDLDEVDIEMNSEIYEKYNDKIPVLMIDERMFAKYRIDEAKLRKKLTGS